MQGDGQTPDRSWVDDAAALLRMIAGSDIEALEVEHRGARFVLRREPRETARPERSVDAAAPAELPPNTYIVPSPLVGIFRRSAGARSEPPIEEGERVTAGQVIGCVEAMRILNRVQTDRAGIVEQIVVEEGQPVEYGQTLIVVRPE